MTQLAKKTVLITGAASGLGRMLAHGLAMQACHLVLWDLDVPGLEVVRSEILEFAPQTEICCQQVDLADLDAINRAATEVLQARPAIDILINNAGVVSGRSLLDLTDAQIERTFAINSIALLRTTRAFLPAMITQQAGHIVTIASAAGLVGTTKLIDYCASKFAAVGFDDALRVELKSQSLSHIRTTVVCPYYIATGMFRGAKSGSIFLPMLQPEAVVSRTITAIQRDRQRVIMPAFVHTISPSRLLPVSWFDAILRWLGVTRSMDEFVGRN